MGKPKFIPIFLVVVCNVILNVDGGLLPKWNTEAKGTGASSQKEEKLSMEYSLRSLASIIEYKKSLLKNMENNKSVDAALHAFLEIDLDSEKRDLYTLNGFVTELHMLETHFYKLNRLVDMPLLYDSLSMRIQQFENVQSMKGKVSGNEQAILKLLHATLLSKTSSIRTDDLSNLILNIENHEIFEKGSGGAPSFDQIKDYVRDNSTNRNQYNEGIRGRGDEVNDFNENELQTEIKKLDDMLNYEMPKRKRPATSVNSTKFSETVGMARGLHTVFNMVAGLCSAFGKIGSATIDGILTKTKDFVPMMTMIQNDRNKMKAVAGVIDSFVVKNDNLEFDTKLKTLKKSLSFLKSTERIAFNEVRHLLKETIDVLDEQITAKDLKNKFNVNKCVEHIKRAISLVSNMFDRIPIYEEQARFADSLNKISLSDYDKLAADGSELGNCTKQLINYLQSNVLYTVYYCSIDALKQSVFPFPNNYMSIGPRPLDYDSVISNAKHNMEKLRFTSDDWFHASSKVMSSNYSFEGVNAFYRWRNYEISDEIAQLFDGKRVYLLTDWSQKPHVSAARITEIGLKIHTNNETVDKQLRKELRIFEVSLTHLGDATTYLGDKPFAMHNRPKTFEHPFSEDQQCLGKNRGKLLSPYTRWAVQLKQHECIKRHMHDSLQPFVRLVDIELHGYGNKVYIKKPEYFPKELNQFYPSQKSKNMWDVDHVYIASIVQRKNKK